MDDRAGGDVGVEAAEPANAENLDHERRQGQQHGDDVKSHLPTHVDRSSGATDVASSGATVRPVPPEPVQSRFGRRERSGSEDDRAASADSNRPDERRLAGKSLEYGTPLPPLQDPAADMLARRRFPPRFVLPDDGARPTLSAGTRAEPVSEFFFGAGTHMPIVTIEDGASFPVEPGTKLVLAIEDNGVDILHKCGGNARCTTCRVSVVAGDAGPIADLERERLARDPSFGPDIRLSCQVRVEHDLTVKVLGRAFAGRRSRRSPAGGLSVAPSVRRASSARRTRHLSRVNG